MNDAQSIETLQVKVGGMSCSFCTETIRKAVGRQEGVKEVHVSLSHEEALIRYDPQKVTSTELRETLRSLGYTVRDPHKVRSFEEQEEELRIERRRLILAGIFAAISAGMLVTINPCGCAMLQFMCRSSWTPGRRMPRPWTACASG